MQSADLVSGIRKEIIDYNLELYKSMFAGSDPARTKDPYGRAALQLYTSLSAADREILFKIIRQTMVDTVSSVLGLLDGTMSLSQQNGPFTLNVSGRQMNGELQDQFLEAEEHGA